MSRPCSPTVPSFDVVRRNRADQRWYRSRRRKRQRMRAADAKRWIAATAVGAERGSTRGVLGVADVEIGITTTGVGGTAVDGTDPARGR